ncbi:hypothetical protein SNE40_015989 [Patella caerulea]
MAQLNTTVSGELRLLKDYGVCMEGDYNSNSEGFWMVGKCPNGYPEKEILERCETSISHPMTKIPVTIAIRRNLTFVNIFCAYCHGIEHFNKNIIIWKSSIVCRQPHLFNEDVSFAKITELLRNAACRVKIDESFSTRRCLPKRVIQQCQQYGDILKNSSNAKLCSRYSQVGVMDKTNGKIYKNPDCALCSLDDGVRLTNTDKIFTCHSTDDITELPNASFMDNIPFTIMFDFNLKKGGLNIRERNILPEKRTCGHVYEVYDTVLDVCTRLYCPPNHTPINGKCLLQTGNIETYWLTFIFAVDPNNSIAVYMDSWLYSSIDSCSIEVHNITNNVFDQIETNTAYGNRPRLSLEAIVLSNCSLSALFNRCYDFLESEFVTNGNLINITLATSKMLQCRDQKHVYMTFDKFKSDIIRRQKVYSFSVTFFSNIERLVHVIMCRPDAQWKLNCSMASYVPSQYEIRGSSLRIIGLTEIVPSSQFVIHDKKAFVCRNYSRNYGISHNLRQKMKFKIFVFIVIGTSIACCLLTIVVYFLLPQLRNIPGRIVMSLAASTAAAQCLGINVIQFSGIVCVLVAIAGHCLWLSVFSWTSVMALDLTRTVNQNGGLSKSEGKRYLLYACLAWGTPFMAVCALAFLEKLGYLNMEYGKDRACWIGNNVLMIYTFGCPVVFCFLVNLCCLIAISIAVSPRDKRLGKTNFIKRKKQFVKIFAKLMFLTGMTWVFMVLPAIFDEDILLWMNVLFNGSSGTYIFVSFVCNKRVYIMLKERFLVKSNNPSIYRISNITI